MKLPQLKQKAWNYTALAFFGPVCLMLILMIIGQFRPFGHYSMLYSDMFHQYYPFFVGFRKALLSGDSLLYSWNVGMGMDYLGLISYYLSSPLNLLCVLVPESMTLDFFALLVPIKLGLAGLFFAVFLRKTFDRNDLSITLFGMLYAMCAWALGYQWNVMWLDTFALLPLVTLGAVSLLRDRKFLLYTVTLFFSIYANYYIGFFTCIFIFLLFFCYEICRWQNLSRFVRDLFRIALFSALAIAMTAFLELPALAALQNTQSSVNDFPTGFRLNIASENTWKGLLDAMRQVAGNMNGALEPTFKEGLPNLYCGTASIFLAFLYLTSPKIRLRDKLCTVALLLFFMLSFIIRQLDYIWHGFHFTNMIPYRFSFLFSFVLLYMAYRAWTLRDSFRPWQYTAAALLCLGIIFCSDSRTDPVYLAYNLLFLGMYLLVFLYPLLTSDAKPSVKRAAASEADTPDEAAVPPDAAPAAAPDPLPDAPSGEAAVSEPAPLASVEPAPEDPARHARLQERRRFSAITACLLLALELVLNLVNFGIAFPPTNTVNYPNGTKYTASMIRYMHERERNNLFFRAEATHSQTLNDGALNGYNGISTFTSSANVRVTEFMQTLGYAAKNTYNRYCFEEGSPVSNLFLSLKYMLERDGQLKDNAYFDCVHTYGSVSLLENNAYLPLGFLTETELASLPITPETNNRFRFQNMLFSAATGLTQEVWKFPSSSQLQLTADNVNIKSQSGNGYVSYSTETRGTLHYTYTIAHTGLMCIDVDMNANNTFTLRKNGTELYSETESLPQMLSVCDVVPGDVITVDVSCKQDETGSMTIRAAVLDEALFRQGYDILAASTLELTEFSNTRVAGTISCNRSGLLYTSIPQDGNWSATVDGSPAEIRLVGDVMAALELSEGTHTIVFTYDNPAYHLGARITLCAVLIFASLSLIRYLPERRRGRFEKTRA